MSKTFSQRNRERCESPNGFNHKLSDWSLSDWGVAVAGEAGEMCNVIKKLNRCRDGIAGNKETKEQLMEKLKREMGDVVIYLDLLAQTIGCDLETIREEVFQRKSAEIGYTEEV